MCKTYLDRVYYTAKVQGKLDWYGEVRASDQKLFQVITTYKEKAPMDGTGKIARTKAAAMWTHLEVLVVKTVILRDVEGQFMYEKEYYAFAETYPGGKLSEDDAKAQWLKWKQDSTDPDTRFPPSDCDGPKSSPYRLWVKTATKLHFQVAQENQKQLQMSEKAKKDMSSVEIDQAHKRLLQDHETCAGAKSLTPDEMVHLMGTAGSGSTDNAAFQGRMVDVGDVTTLLPEEKPKAQKEDGQHDDGDAPEEDDEGDDEESKKTPSDKSSKWLDWDAAISTYVRGEEKQIALLRKAVDKTLVEMKTLLDQISSPQYSQLLPILGIEHRLASQRYDFLLLTVSDASDVERKLIEAIQVVKRDEEFKGSDSGKGKGGGKGGKGGKSPPSATYQQVKSFKELSSGTQN